MLSRYVLKVSIAPTTLESPLLANVVQDTIAHLVLVNLIKLSVPQVITALSDLLKKPLVLQEPTRSLWEPLP